jgi:hypothetical protein
MTPKQYADYMMADRVLEIRSRFIERMQASAELPYGTVQWKPVITDTDGNVIKSSVWLIDRYVAFWHADDLWNDMWNEYEKAAP